VLEESGLADPRVATDDEHPALPTLGLVQQPLDQSALLGAIDQAGRPQRICLVPPIEWSDAAEPIQGASRVKYDGV
jgi:hypothetical protein